MSYEHKPGNGRIFKNDKKAGKQPDMKGGACCPFCKAQMDVAAWESDKGGLSLKLSEPYNKEAKPVEIPEPASPAGDGFDDDIPF